MYMSPSARSSPTPRITSRVMMTGLIGPDLRRADFVRTVTTFIACRSRILGPSRSGPRGGATFQERRPASAGGTGRGAARRRAVLMREFSGRGRRYRLSAFAQPELDPAKGRFARGVLLAELRRADPTRPALVAQDVAVDAHRSIPRRGPPRPRERLRVASVSRL